MGSSKHGGHSSSRSRRRRRDDSLDGDHLDNNGSAPVDDDVRHHHVGGDDDVEEGETPPSDRDSKSNKRHHKRSRHHKKHKHHRRRSVEGEAEEGEEEVPNEVSMEDFGDVGGGGEEETEEKRRKRRHKEKKSKRSKNKSKKRKLEDEYEAISDDEDRDSDGLEPGTPPRPTASSAVVVVPPPRHRRRSDVDELDLEREEEDLSPLSLSPRSLTPHTPSPPRKATSTHKDKDRDRERSRRKDEGDRERSRGKRERSPGRRRRHSSKDKDRDKDKGRSRHREEKRPDRHHHQQQWREEEDEQPPTPPPTRDEEQGQGQGSASLSIEETNKLRARLGLKPLKVDPPKPTKEATSLSIEETNRIRAKMGLKPLKIDEQPSGSGSGSEPVMVEGGVQMDGFVHKPAGNISKNKKEEEIREKLRLRREKRALESKLASRAPLLAAKDDDEDDEDSAAAWVRKVKNAEKEKKDAEKRAKMLEEMDREFGLGDLVEDEFDRDRQRVSKAKQYSADALKGVKVKHSVKDLAAGKEVILTLEDKNVLDEEGDELMNVNLKDIERARKNIKNRSKKVGYDAYDEEEDDLEEETASRALLKQYDEVIEGEKADSFVLGGSKTRVAEPSAAEKLAIKNRLKQVESLVHAPEVATLAREYYTQDEYDAKFKKKKKKVKNEALRGARRGKDKKKKRGLTADDLLDDLAEPMRDQPIGMDIDRDDSDLDQSDGDFPARGLNDEDLSSIVLEPDEAQIELEATLNRARKLRKVKLESGAQEESSVERLAREIRERRQNGLDKEEEDNDDDVGGPSSSSTTKRGELLTFNETAEFARTLGDTGAASDDEEDMFGGGRRKYVEVPEPPMRSPSPLPESDDEVVVIRDDDAMDISGDDDDVVELQQDGFGRWSKAEASSGGKFKKPGHMGGAGPSGSGSSAPKPDTVLEEEPDVSQSMVAALKLATKKGYLEEVDGKKAPSGLGLAALRARSYTIEDKASLDEDWKASRGRGERGGGDRGGGGREDRYSGPIMDFKDKDNYRPDINLEYIDDQGRKLTPKEAFRYLSHKFHGKGSGKMKTEKRMKKMAEQTAVAQMSSTDTPLGTVGKMIEKQKESHTPFLLLSGNRVTSAAGGVLGKH